MRRPSFMAAALAVGLFLVCAPRASFAEPIVPKSDDEMVEGLPAASATRDEDRRLRKLLASRPNDATLALSVAKRDLARAREAGDPRFAGLALAALTAWP